MSTMVEKIIAAKKCKTCQFVDKGGFIKLIQCQGCKDQLAARAAVLKFLSIDEYIREIVNGRCDVGSDRDHSYALYERYCEDMPYGTAKGRDGDPYEWIYYQLCEDHEDLIEDEVEA